MLSTHTFLLILSSTLTLFFLFIFVMSHDMQFQFTYFSLYFLLHMSQNQMFTIAWLLCMNIHWLLGVQSVSIILCYYCSNEWKMLPGYKLAKDDGKVSKLAMFRIKTNQKLILMWHFINCTRFYKTFFFVCKYYR